MQPSQEQIAEAVAVLQNGGVVVFPTETSYGVAADATNHQAAERAFAIKQRAHSAPSGLIVATVEMAKWCGRMDAPVEELAEKHWPGPLTIVLPEANDALTPLCKRDGTVAVRVSSHPVARALAEQLGKPILATSANIAGQDPAFTIDQAREQFSDNEPDLYLDGGPLEPSPPSMIIEWQDGELVVHRNGSFKL